MKGRVNIVNLFCAVRDVPKDLICTQDSYNLISTSDQSEFALLGLHSLSYPRQNSHQSAIRQEFKAATAL